MLISNSCIKGLKKGRMFCWGVCLLWMGIRRRGEGKLVVIGWRGELINARIISLMTLTPTDWANSDQNQARKGWKCKT